MGRQKSFDEEVLLDKAMLLFWEKGYDRTSLKDLEVVFDLTPPSIYNTFGHKNELFARVLDRYIEIVVIRRLEQFLKPSSNPIHNIEKFLQSAVGHLIKDKPRFGCLLTNTAIESKQLNKLVGQKIEQGLNNIQSAFYQELLRAQKSGLLSSQRDPKNLSSWLLTCYQGLLVLARLNVSEKQLKERIQSITSELKK